jgi:hypothetical protein
LVHAFDNPALYGLFEAHCQEWDNVVAELMQELNSLLMFQHPHVVHVECFGLQTVLGVDLPGYVALHLCTQGTLAAWIKDGRSFR